MEKPITIEEFLTRSELSQHDEGDCLPSEFESQLPEHVKLDDRPLGTGQLLDCWEKLSSHDQITFQKQYGDLSHLLKIRVQHACFQAMIGFWDPEYRCFTFDTVDMTPTIEEYESLLNCPKSEKVYFYTPIEHALSNFAWITQIDCQLAKSHATKRGNSQGWFWNELEAIFKRRLHDESNEIRLRILALGIYGLVLFPSAEGMIDFEAVNVFKNVVTLKINPATAILAETFSSLNYCRKAGRGRLRCCLQLLFVWTVSHMIEGKISGLVGTPWHLYSQLENFAEKHLHEVGKTTWESMFLSLSKSQFHWRSRYAYFKSYLAYCGEYPWVPLIGARCCISYCPNLVLRQFGFEQFIPRTTKLATFYEDFKTSKKLLESVKKAWKHPGRVTSAKRVEGKTTEGYPIWQKKRGKGYKVPSFEGPPRSLIQSAEDTHEEVRAQQESYNLSLNAEVEELWAKKRKLESNLLTRETALAIIKQEKDDLSAQLQHQQLEFQQLQEKYVLLSEDKRKQDVNMKRWVRRASKAEKMVLKLEEKNEALQEQCQNHDTLIANLDAHVDHLLSIEQTLSSEKEKAEKEAECWASEAMRYHVQADDAKNYALGLRGLAQQIADGEPMTRNEFHQFFGLIRDGINEISAYDGPRLWKD